MGGEKVELQLTSKALNGAWNVQPASPKGHHNVHGCCVNHWFQVPITLDPSTSKDTIPPEGDFANKPSGGKFATPFRNLDQPKMKPWGTPRLVAGFSTQGRQLRTDH